MIKIINIFILIFFSACAVIVKEDNVPSWYLSPPKNNAEKLYGVGVGNKEQAIKIALNNISENLVVKISSNYKHNISEVTVNENSEIESSTNKLINAETLNIEFNNYEIVQIANNPKATYVLISVNREALLNKYLALIDEEHKKIEDHYMAVENDIPIKKLIMFNKIDSLLKEQQVKIKLVKAISENNSIASNYSSFYQKINADKLSVKEKAVIHIISKSSDSRIANALSSALSKLGFNIKYNQQQDQNDVILRLSSKAEHKEIYGNNMVKINVTLKLIENFGKQIAVNNLEIQGSSRINSSAAIDSAIRDLNNKINQKGIFNILGI